MFVPELLQSLKDVETSPLLSFSVDKQFYKIHHFELIII